MSRKFILTFIGVFLVLAMVAGSQDTAVAADAAGREAVTTAYRDHTRI